jgi:hypothetical protein
MLPTLLRDPHRGRHLRQTSVPEPPKPATSAGSGKQRYAPAFTVFGTFADAEA